MRKIFTFLFAALMSVGMWAEPIEVVWNSYDIPTDGSGNSFTKDGVTVTCGGIDWDNPDFYNGGTFTTDLGNFTHIYVYASDIDMSGNGWSGTTHQQTWTGNAASVSFEGGMHSISDIWFYIEPAGAVPSWVKSGDVWDETTKTLTVNGNPVSYAYNGVSDIENLVISDAVTSIGDNAFEDCNGLKSVSFGSSLASIGKEAFSSCIKLESVTFPASLQSIGKKAFSQCYALTSVTITNGLTSIGQQAFFNCEKLASVNIPNSVTDIGSSAFGNCKVLTEIVVAAENPNYSSADGVLFDKAKTTLIQCPGGKQGEYTVPNSVTSIGNSAFSSCYLLTSVEIPNSVGEIGVQAFSSCIELTSVTIGNGVTSIGGYAFYYCSKLASVTINATTPPTLGNEALNKTAAALTIYVPAASVDDYKGAWTAYADKIEAISGGDEPAGEVITWDSDFCSNVEACFDSWEWQHVEANNTKDGITVTYSNSNDHGWKVGTIDLYVQENILTFTSTVGDISKIEVYYSANYGSTPNGWTLDATNKKFVWEGTAAAAVDMVGGYVYFIVDYIVFTIAGSNTAIENVQTNHVQATKFFRNGMLLIEKNGKIYNVMGAEVK